MQTYIEATETKNLLTVKRLDYRNQSILIITGKDKQDLENLIKDGRAELPLGVEVAKINLTPITKHGKGYKLMVQLLYKNGVTTTPISCSVQCATNKSNEL